MIRGLFVIVVVCSVVAMFMYKDELMAAVWCDYSCEVWKDIDDIITDINIFTE